MPFPGRGARFTHPDHPDADRRRALSVDSLYGWRALAISPRHNDTFRLVGELRAYDLDKEMQAAASSITDLEVRIAAMRRVLQEMVGEHADENWDYLAHLLDVSHGLPATTFDAMDCLADIPAALAGFLLRTPQEERRARIWRLEYELPFTWLLVPVAVWREEMRRTNRAIRKELEEVGVFEADEVRQRADERLTQVSAEAARFCPGLLLLRHFADEAVSDHRVVLDTTFDPPQRETLDALLRTGPYQVLLQGGDDYRWPRGPDRSDWAAEIAVLTESPWRETLWADCRGVGFRRPLTDAPFGAAVAAASGIRVSRRLVHATKLLRSQAREWFDAAYTLALARMLRVDIDSVEP